jgi:hypothetical protein
MSREGVGWASVREAVLERDNYKCRFCEITEEEHRSEYDRGLSAHHITPRRDGGSDTLENLITVCQSCHTTLEKLEGGTLSGSGQTRERVDGRDEDGRFSEKRTDTEVLDAVQAHAPAPTSDVADDLDVTRQAADYRLRRLQEEDRVASKKIGGALAWTVTDR